jgi:hypothetical protein
LGVDIEYLGASRWRTADINITRIKLDSTDRVTVFQGAAAYAHSSMCLLEIGPFRLPNGQLSSTRLKIARQRFCRIRTKTNPFLTHPLKQSLSAILLEQSDLIFRLKVSISLFGVAKLEVNEWKVSMETDLIGWKRIRDSR